MIIVLSDLPGSLQSAVRPLLDAVDYVGPVRKVVLAGGCNCSRLGLVIVYIAIVYSYNSSNSSKLSCFPCIQRHNYYYEYTNVTKITRLAYVYTS